MRKRLGFVAPALVLAAATIALELYVRAGFAPGAVAAPTGIVKTLIAERWIIWGHLEPTLLTAMTGLLLALLLSSGVALFVHKFRRAENSAMAVAAFVDSLPMIAVAPVLTIWMGEGLGMRVCLTTIICTFPIFVSFVQGLKATPAPVDEMFRMLAASSNQRFKMASLPYSLPYLFIGLRTAAPLAMFGALIAEWTGAERGLGAYMINAMFSLRADALWAAVVTASAVSIGLYLLVAAFEALALPDRGEGEKVAP
jgi:NitT/TauT family transport system permease protein